MAIKGCTYDGSGHIVTRGDLYPLLDPSSRSHQRGRCGVMRVDVWLVDSVWAFDKDGSAPSSPLAFLSEPGGWAPRYSVSCRSNFIADRGKICLRCVDLLHRDHISIA